MKTSLLAASLALPGCGNSEGETASRAPVSFEEDREIEAVEAVKCEANTVRECYRTLGEHGGVVSCFTGTETCRGDGTWGPCVNGEVTTIEAAEADELGRSLLALSDTSECEDNPCSPSCREFEETPDEVGEEFTIELTSGFDWEEGALSSFPKGLVQKGLSEPCSTGSDCQFNTQCQAPTSGECAHDKCTAGDPLAADCDTCVSWVCEEAPWCCGVEEEEEEPDESLVCCDGESSFNGSCYRLVEEYEQWSAGRASCQALGTDWDFVSIASDEENDFVFDLTTSSNTWIGFTEGNDIGSNGKWRWTSGDPAGEWNENSGNGLYENFYGSEPDSGEECARMMNDSGWYGRDCYQYYHSMCEGPPSCEAEEEEEVSGGSECCDGESAYGDSCYLYFDSTASWTDARAACQEIGDGWELVAIEDEAENEFVADLSTADNAWIGLTEGNGVGSTGQWRWSSGDPSGTWSESSGSGMWDTFQSGEPDSGEECARIRDDQDWSGRDCWRSYAYVCEGPQLCGDVGGGEGEFAPACAHDPCVTGDALADNCDECVVAVCAADSDCCTDEWSSECVALVDTECSAQCECGDDEDYYLGHCYYLEESSTDWSSAWSACQARGDGWDLVSIGDGNENDFVAEMTTSDNTWIGITEGNGVGSNGQWRWTNGDPSGTWWESSRSGIYDNFDSGEPDNGEQCARMMGDEEWYGRQCNQNYDYICESPVSALSELTPVFIPAPEPEPEEESDDAMDAEESDEAGEDEEPYDGPREWTEECVALAEQVCDVRCGEEGEPTTGSCVPWYPDEFDESCDGYDLAVGVPCDGSIPVCNHGSVEAPSGIRLVHFPANSNQYPQCSPDQTHPQMHECWTDEPIAPGTCINVTSCPGMVGIREIMVNPDGADHVEECSCLDNWSLFKAGTECGPPTCSGGTNSASAVERPVDIIIGIDNSASMQGEIEAVQERINDDFSRIIENSGIDYRLIMVSRYGNVHVTNYGGGGPYDSAYAICVGSPLSSLDCPTSALDSTPTLAHSGRFYHHSTDIGSRDLLCKLVNSYDTTDPINALRVGWTPIAPNGWSEFLREDAMKVFVGITDDGAGTNTFGTNGYCASSTGYTDTESGAEQFDEDLRRLAPEQFGAYDSGNPDSGRNYVFHSIVGMAGNDTTNPTAIGPDESIEARCCKGDGSRVTCTNDSFGTPASDAVANGLAYQYLSKMTGGLRYPVCYNNNFDDIFNEIAKVVIDGARVSCSFQLQNEGSFDINTAQVFFSENDEDDPIEFTQVDSADDCGVGNWYQPDPDNETLLELCPSACAVVQDNPDGQLSLEVGCLGSGYEPKTFTEAYAATCSFDEAVQWGHFGIEVDTPGDSTVEVWARTADTEAGLADASYVKLATLSAEEGNEDCTSPDVEGCPIDLYEALGGAPDAHYEYIEIQTTVTPTSDGSQMPLIEDWQINYSCPDIN